MQLDPESIRQAFTALGTVLTLLKQAKDLLPDNAKKQEISQTIEKVEKELVTAEVESARALGYEICRNHWPAGIMLSSDNKNWKCPNCGNTKTYQKVGLGSAWNSLGKK
jgi:rubrerythrin